MKSNQKGFTLIELLAVIVILAVIALIATPLVMGVINRARENAAIDSVYGYLDAVEQSVAEYQLTSEGMNFNPSGVIFTVDTRTNQNGRNILYSMTNPTGTKVTINADGTLGDTFTIYNPETKTGNVLEIEVNYQGSAPTAGSFKFDEEGNISSVDSIVVNGYNVKVDAGVGSIAPSPTN